eukprot:CAMPEP_0117665678 /NCGR_PEP_ID=MMETSP0804-20121206/9949_1 /TAXON_ID=1074897 /ORGANISM="Tetraselmis astigmatica, Strain CCMP880" /LENGTH=447 /DNA_ID=CAMNT_0005473129 /DNA_START=37 /DNA_END=1380 /DNA_ORIENTATION=+
MSSGRPKTDTLGFSGDAVYMEEVYSELGGSVIVEHCVNCEKHASTTNHNPAKYKKYYDAIEILVGRCFPYCEVEANNPDVLQRITGKRKPRIGTFEVYVSNEDGSSKQAVFSKALTNKWPNLPQLGRYIMNVIEPNKVRETQFDDDGTLLTSTMPDAPWIHTHGPYDTRNPVVSEKVWGFGTKNCTTHGLHYDTKLILPKGPDEPQSTWKEAVWRDYNTMQRTAKPAPPPEHEPEDLYDQFGPEDHLVDVAALEPITEAALSDQPGSVMPEGESTPAAAEPEPSGKSEGLLPPVPDAEPASPKEDSTADVAPASAEGENIAPPEAPKEVDPAAEAPAADAAAKSEPAADVADTPKVDEPAAEAPKKDAPAAEANTEDAPAAEGDKPAAEKAPAAEEEKPVQEAPKKEEPAGETPAQADNAAAAPAEEEKPAEEPATAPAEEEKPADA